MVGPTALHLLTNSECNLDCAFCNTRKGRRQKQPKTVTPAFVDELLDAFPSIEAVYLGGSGEPLMFAGLPAIIERLHARSVSVAVTTNGTLVIKRRDIPWNLVDVVSVSLLESNAPAYEKLTGADLYKQAYIGTFGLVGMVPHVQISNVVTRDNVERIPDFLDLGERLNVKSIFLRNDSLIPGEDWEKFREERALHADVPGLVDRLRAVKRQTSVSVRWPRVSDFSKVSYPCPVVNDMLVVNGDGDVAICCRGPGPRSELGNIKNRWLWASAELTQFRTSVEGPEEGWPEKCRCCFARYREVPI